MYYCLDTNQISYLLKGQFQIQQSLAKIRIEDLCTTTITIYELLSGYYRLNDNRWHIENVNLLLNQLKVLTFDHESSLVSAKIKSHLKTTGKIIEDADLMIAGICIANDLTLITANTSHFERIPELKIENWA
ncbi:MAG: type II toxin-antitoxin system VapC family toxin [bacterium]